jgi:hypothetical protein
LESCWLKSDGAHNATALELCKAMKKTWKIAGHNDDEEDNEENNDSMGLET